MPLFAKDSADAASIVAFAVIGVVLGTILELLLKSFNSPIPYTVLLFYLGIFLALLLNYLNIESENFLELGGVSSDLMAYVFFPILLFSETMKLNWHHLTQSFAQAVLLAGPGGVIVCLLLAACAKGILPYDWSWLYYLLFGAILCATDPVSVISAMKTTKASAKLTMVISGESLLNDGSAMILYFFFYNLINGMNYTFGSFLSFVAEMLLLSPLIGFLMGLITSRIMRRINSPTSPRLDIQVFLTFVCGYSSFYVAQGVLNISGVLSCCTAGVTVSLFAPLHVLSDHNFQVVWENAEWTCNTLVFLLAGFLVGSDAAATVSLRNVGFLVIFYFILLVTRGIMCFLLLPVTNRIGKPFSFNETVFMTLSGLRGALGIALALTGAENATNLGHNQVAKEFFFMVSGLASLTLLINGSTAGWLLLKLRLVDDPNAPVSAQLEQVLYRIRLFLRMYLHRELVHIKPELGHYSEKELFRLCELMRPEFGDEEHDAMVPAVEDTSIDAKKNHGVNRKGHSGSMEDMKSSGEEDTTDDDAGDIHANLKVNAFTQRNRRMSLAADYTVETQISERVANSHVIDADLLTYTRETFLNVVRARYEDSIETGKIGSSSTSFKLLLHSLDVAMDDVHYKLSDWDVVKQLLRPNKYLVTIAGHIDSFFYLFGIVLGLVSRLDAYYERIAMYVLTNFIDAHEYAQSRMNFFMGGMINGTKEDIAAPEERQVLLESTAFVEQAKELLSVISSQDLLMLYTHRAAKVINHKQGEMLERMVREGIISEKNARSLFDSYEMERNKVDLERAARDVDILHGNITKKIEEEKELRSSFAAMQGDVALMSPMHFLRSSFAGNIMRPSLSDLEAPPPASVSRPTSVSSAAPASTVLVNNSSNSRKSSNLGGGSGGIKNGNNDAGQRESVILRGSETSSIGALEVDSIPPPPPEYPLSRLGMSPKRGEGIFNRVSTTSAPPPPAQMTSSSSSASPSASPSAPNSPVLKSNPEVYSEK